MATKKISRQREIFSKNLVKLMAEHSKNSVDVANDNNWSTPTVRSWINCTRYPRIDKIQELADYFKVSRRELLEDTDYEELNPRTVQIPIIDIVKEHNIFSNENIASYKLEAPENIGAELFYIRAYDKSMEPTIPEESLVKVESTQAIQENDLVVVLPKLNSLPQIRRIEFLDNNFILLRCDNNEYKDLKYDYEKIRILGKVISYTKTF